MTTTRLGPALLKPSDVACRLNVTTATLARWRSAGTGPRYINVTDRTVRYRPADIVAWVEASTSLAGGAPSVRDRAPS
ncbi:DNA-binding protein [Aeromicrobium phragmitis]|uniref:DNA-binding protein n=2 Tax=Aeromicrobium TaxID=2040 RepID=A0A3N6W3C1_9ACTN|nr:DNA-binding protein [Aeromicrobium phragmitis]RQN02019.1 DNA-binding protein [Aeromicrobium camelliae]